MIIQLNTGKCEKVTVLEARRMWFALTGERTGLRGDKQKAKRIHRWFFPPNDMPDSYKRHQEIEAGDPPTLNDNARGWMGAYDGY